ncbi:MAG: hypothetical protein HY097_03010 [Nitrospinae bacterium]|nr:hypothetical protein [Nitrospinota bacterium]
MAISIPIDVYDLLEDKLGKEEARKVASAIEVSLETIEKRAETVALQKKLELKDELTKELATKADLLVLREEFFGEIKSLKAELEKKIEVEIANVKAEIIKWMFLFWIGQLASLIAILKLFRF